MTMLILRLCCALVALQMLIGCSSHVVTPSGADMSRFGMIASEQERRWQSDRDVADVLDKAPLARFPSTIAIVRVQGAGPHSRSSGVSYGRGAYRVILTPTVETEKHIHAIDELDQVNGAVRLNRLVLGSNLHSDKELRTAAARLHADLTLIYTINTEWTIDDDPKPLDTITFGFARFRNITVTSTATALLLGTHNGYVYATAEVAKDKRYKDNAWNNSEQIEEAQELLEQQAFDGLVQDFVQAWPRVLQQYAPSQGAQR